MKNKLLYTTILFCVSLMPNLSFAVCPLCTVAVSAGVGLSHWIGVDDLISGLWIGGFVMSSVIWTINWLDSKNIHFKGRKILTILTYYGFVIIPLDLDGLIGRPFNTVWGIDKLISGIVIGSVVFLPGYIGYAAIKRRRGRAYFPFQKVVMPVAPLLILTLIFYFMV